MRLIDADEVLAKKNQFWNYILGEYCVPVSRIEDIPTADVVERKKGFWEYVDDVDYRCSVCHKYAYGCLGEVLSGQYKYCPYCGADMREEKTDENLHRNSR